MYREQRPVDSYALDRKSHQNVIFLFLLSLGFDFHESCIVLARLGSSGFINNKLRLLNIPILVMRVHEHVLLLMDCVC